MIPYPAFNSKNALRNGAPLSVYGIWGDAYLQDAVLVQLLDWALGDGERDFNMDSLDGDTAKITDVLAACGNLPFLADYRVIVVRRAEKLEGVAREDGGKKSKKEKTGATPAQRLSEGIANLPPTSVLILMRTPETPEPGERVNERCLNAALDSEIDRFGLRINCLVDAKNTGLATAIVEREAKARGILLERGAATHLVERCGADIAFLCSELEKCSLRAGLNVPVSTRIIDEMTQRALHDTVFDLTDAIGERKGNVAVAMVRELVGRGEAPELLMALIVSHLRRLMQARAFLDANLPLDASLSKRISPQLAAQLPSGRDNLAQTLITQAWMGRRLAAQARNFSSSQLARALELAFETDLAMKGIEGDGGFESRYNSAASLEILVAKLCAGS